MLVVGTRPLLCMRPSTRASEALELHKLDEELKRRVQGAIDGIGAVASAAVTGLTGGPCRLLHTPIGEHISATALPAVDGASGVTRLRLIEPPSDPSIAFDAFLDVDLSSYDAQSRPAVVASLSDVLHAAAELFGMMACASPASACASNMQIHTCPAHPPPRVVSMELAWRISARACVPGTAN